MTITAIQAVSSFGGVSFYGASPVRRQVSLVEQAPLLAPRGVTVTLGASQPPPLTYNAVGLLQSLNLVESSNVSTSDPLALSDSAQLQAQLETLLRLNTDTSNSGNLSTRDSISTLSAEALRALNTVLANQLGEAGASERSQAENELLAQLLNSASSRLNSASEALTAGTLPQATLDTSSFTALWNSILNSNLDLSSLPLGVLAGQAALSNIGTPGLFSSGGFSLFGQSPAGSLLSIGAPGLFSVGATGTQPQTDISASADPSLTAVPGTSGVGSQYSSIARRVAAADDSVGNAPVTSTGQGVVTRPSAERAARPLEQTLPLSADLAMTSSPIQVSDTAQSAINTVAGNPNYAEAVASLYLSAAVFRAQSHQVDATIPDESTEVRTVSAIQHVQDPMARQSNDFNYSRNTFELDRYFQYPVSTPA
ncbi:MAG: hypothetical protein K9L88_11720 [Chromatiaceae bacterium]|nr:hypothetical protein [Chromatiaceae bacterium]